MRILVVTDDVLGASMAGPAIRAWEISSALAADHEVVLATTSGRCERTSERFEVRAGGFEELERWCDLMVVQGWVLENVPVLKASDRIMVVDLYDPIFFEHLEMYRSMDEPHRSAVIGNSVRVFIDQASRGDFFLCASEKQRDLWTGFLTACGRVNPTVYDDDPSLRRLIDVVPFGIPSEPPVGVVPAPSWPAGVSPGDEVVLWNGGVYDWLDPVTAVEAVERVGRTRGRVRLVFMGVGRPDPAAAEPAVLAEARRVAGPHTFFNDGWVPYETRSSFLLGADVAISLHRDHVETAYSFRTRLLDCLWAGLPVVATAGDGFESTVARIGAVVAPGDVAGVAAALEGLLADPERRRACSEQARSLAGGYEWGVALGPLIRFCSEARRAVDRPAPSTGAAPAPGEGRRRLWPPRRR